MSGSGNWIVRSPCADSRARIVATTSPSARSGWPSSCGCCQRSRSSWNTSTEPLRPSTANAMPALSPTHRCNQDSSLRISRCPSEAHRPARGQRAPAPGVVVVVGRGGLREVADVLAVEQVLDAKVQRAGVEGDARLQVEHRVTVEAARGRTAELEVAVGGDAALQPGRKARGPVLFPVAGGAVGANVDPGQVAVEHVVAVAVVAALGARVGQAEAG